MSRFIGSRGIIDNLLEGANFSMTGNIVVPTSNVASSELMALSTATTCLSSTTNRSQCVISVFNQNCCQGAGGSANPLYCTWTVPSGVQSVVVQMWGAGGGGGRGCGPAGRGVGVPGGSGGFVHFRAATVAGEVWCLRAGSGGTGVTYAGQGCQGDCSCICRVGGGLEVSAFGGGGGPACRDCYGTIGTSGAYGGGSSFAQTTCILSCHLRAGGRMHASGPYCACGYCCSTTAQRGADAFMGGWGAWGNCKAGKPCSDSGGNFALSFGGGGAGGTGHGSGQGLYSTPCCRGGRGGAGKILIWM